MPRIFGFLLTFLAAALVTGCAWTIDPERPPLKDYEPPEIDGIPDAQPPSRI